MVVAIIGFAMLFVMASVLGFFALVVAKAGLALSDKSTLIASFSLAVISAILFYVAFRYSPFSISLEAV